MQRRDRPSFAEKMHPEKLERLRRALRETSSALVAFSSGTDSALLLKVAHETLGENAVAATVSSAALPEHELEEAKEFCRSLGVRHEIVEVDIKDIPGFCRNEPDRCYRCKKHIFSQLLALKERLGLSVVIEGSNADDGADFRPGLKAIAELGVKSPLRDAGLSKKEIREISRALAIATWNKSASACLASRIPYRQPITEEMLKRADAGEMFLKSLSQGLKQSRVRIHGDIARIEVEPSGIQLIAAHAGEIAAYFADLGFAYTALDLAGYRTGSLNETLTAEEIASAKDFAKNNIKA